MASSPSEKKHDLGKFGIWGVLGVTLFLFLLQTNGATLGIVPSLIGYSIASLLLVGSLLRHAIPHWAGHHRTLSLAGSICICTAGTWWGCHAQFKKEVRTLVPVTNAKVGSLVYDGTPHTPLLLSVSPPGATAELQAQPQRDAGIYRATITGVGDYTGKIEVDWTIQRRPLTVTARSPTKVYDGSLLSVDAPKVDGRLDRDFVFIRAVPSSVGPDAGNFPTKAEISPSADLGNYDITLVDGVAKIAGRDFSARVRDLTYDGLRHHAEVFALYPENADMVLIGDEQTECGTYTATLSGRKNYEGTERNVEWKILPLKPELTLGEVRGANAACTSLLLPVEVRGINPTGQIFVWLLQIDSPSATSSRGHLVGEKTSAVLKNGAVLVEYALPAGNRSTLFLAKVEYLGDRNHEPFTGQVVVSKPAFTLNSVGDALYHLQAALAELRQVYVADSANVTSAGALKSAVEIVTRLSKESTTRVDRFELSQAYPAIEPDIDHAMAGFDILRQLIKASSANHNLLGRYHAELASSYSDIDITLMYLRNVREAAKTDNKETGYGPSYLQNLPMLCRHLRSIIQTILEDLDPAMAVPNNSMTIAESIGSVDAGPLHITVRNLQFVSGSRKDGRSNYATCVVEFMNTRSNGDIQFAANGGSGEPNHLRCYLRAPNGTAFVASDFGGFSAIAVEAENPQPGSIAWVVMHGRNAEAVPGFFSLRRAVWIGGFSMLHAGQKVIGTVSFFPQDRDDLYRNLTEGSAKLAVQFQGEFVVAASGDPGKSCELFDAKIDKRVEITETRR